MVVDTDPVRPVFPAGIWKEIARVGFVPAEMKVWATGTFDGDSFRLGDARWALAKPAPPGKRRAHLKVTRGGEDPPRVEVLE